MNHYEEGINAMWEEVEGKKPESIHQPSDKERWKEFVEKYSHSGYLVQSEFGVIDTTDDAMKDVAGGENLSYEEYLQVLFNSRNIIRHCFEYCYYSNAWCDFKGRISRFDKKKGKVIFNCVYVSGGLMDGDCYEGKEDHVWMDMEPFEEYQVGDCLSFGGEIYRYLKTKNGKQISFGIREPYDIKKIESYELPSDDDMLMQAVDQMICEVCMFNEHCYMGMCKDLLGKVMTPILLILIAVIFVGVVVKFPTVVRQADASYKGHALQHGFVTGYQTMDILAAFNFGAVIAMNIEAFGVKNRKGVAKETILAGIGAGILLCIVYSATAYIGVLCSSKVGNVENGTQILTYAVHACFGIYGKVLIGIIFFIACFNVCVGLLCCCSAYFHELVPKISYFKWLLVFSVFSFVISCAGLNAILNVSLPILKVMCPIAIALTFYGLVRRKRQ